MKTLLKRARLDWAASILIALATRVAVWPVNHAYHALRYWIYRPDGRVPVLRGTPLSAIPKRVCVFAMYQKSRISANLVGVLNLLRKHGYHVLLINNAALVAEEVDKLTALQGVTYVERPNFGRDFGAYKCGTAILMRHLGGAGLDNLDHVLYANDSVYYWLDRLDRLLSSMPFSDVAWAGINDTNQGLYHISSWFFSVSGPLFATDYVRAYWRRYRALSARPHSIRKGEIGFSKMLLRNRHLPKVLFSSGALLARLKTIAPRLDVTDIVQMFPHLGRIDPSGYEAQAIWSRKRRRNPITPTTIFQIEELQSAQNKTHFWQLFALLYCDAPFVKRDIFTRQTFTREQIDACLHEIAQKDPAVASEIAQAVYARGDPRFFPLLDRLKMRLGLL